MTARGWILVSWLCLLLQVGLTDYAHDGESALSYLLGTGVLWLVLRHRSRVARGFVVITSLFGAVVYGLAAAGDGRAAVLALLWLGQALPLLTPSVRRHVQERPYLVVFG